MQHVTYKIVLVCNGVFKKTLVRTVDRATAFTKFHALVEMNKSVVFPRKFINVKKILPAEYEIYIIKPTEEGDKFRILRDDMGRTYHENPIDGYTILHSHDYNIEETFLMFGMAPHTKVRPNINDIIKKVTSGITTESLMKQVIVVNNKLVIYNDDTFDLVLCKCKLDAQRLHHAMYSITKKRKITSLVFMGTATPATIVYMYKVIKDKTKWSHRKIRKSTTRP